MVKEPEHFHKCRHIYETTFKLTKIWGGKKTNAAFQWESHINTPRTSAITLLLLWGLLLKLSVWANYSCLEPHFKLYGKFLEKIHQLVWRAGLPILIAYFLAPAYFLELLWSVKTTDQNEVPFCQHTFYIMNWNIRVVCVKKKKEKKKTQNWLCAS